MTNRRRKLLRVEKWKEKEKEWVKSSIYPSDEKQTTIGAAQTCVSSKGIGCLIRVLLSLFLCKWERWRRYEKERERHLYFIGLDAVMPPKLMLQLSGGRRETAQHEWKRENNEWERERGGEGWGRWEDTKKKEKSEIWEQRWKGAWQVNLEQISIVTEQESWMWWVVTGSG